MRFSYEAKAQATQAAQAVHRSGRPFQQAKNPATDSRFLQIVAKPNRATSKKTPKITRVAFTVSRLMEFCTLRELQNQTGHSLYEWPLVVEKELIDNALDACEEAEIAPVISIASSIPARRNAITFRFRGGNRSALTIVANGAVQAPLPFFSFPLPFALPPPSRRRSPRSHRRPPR